MVDTDDTKTVVNAEFKFFNVLFIGLLYYAFKLKRADIKNVFL